MPLPDRVSPPASPYRRLLAEWNSCRRCELCAGRKKVVMARGKIPCDVMLVGEAPGESEDVLGVPFIGPAGHLLDQIVAKALRATPHLRILLSNLVACIPREEDGGKATEPPFEAIQACGPRLQRLMEIARPSLLVTVGSLARDWLDRKVHPRVVSLPPSVRHEVHIKHPAALLRMNEANQGLEIQRCVITLRDAFAEHEEWRKAN